LVKNFFKGTQQEEGKLFPGRRENCSLVVMEWGREVSSTVLVFNGEDRGRQKKGAGCRITECKNGAFCSPQLAPPYFGRKRKGKDEEEKGT